MSLEKQLMNLREELGCYADRKEVVAAMEANGRCSREVARRWQQALDFAIARQEVQIGLAVKKLNEGTRWSRFVDSADGDGAAVFVFGGPLLHWVFGIGWLPAILLGCLLGLLTRNLSSIVRDFKEMHRNSQRLIDLTVYSVAHLVAQRENVSLYEARSRVEYMRYPETEFESELLDEDMHRVLYQMSFACAWRKCNECDGTSDHSPSGQREPCLHDCHWTKPGSRETS